MQFLKILFWCLLAFVAAVFTIGNWQWVTIRLFGNLVAEVNLPLLLLVTFLVGFLPTFLYFKTIGWRLRRRLGDAQRTLGDIRVAAAPYAAEASPPPPPPTPEPAVTPTEPAVPATEPADTAPPRPRKPRTPKAAGETPPEGGLL
jgi:lipopolysaccharide assembly protein A